MFYNCVVEPLLRLGMLSDQMQFELDGHLNQGAVGVSSETGPNHPGCFTPKKPLQEIFVHPAQLPDGTKIKLLKTLLTSACERDCYYCPFRAGRDFRRATFRPDEFAALFMHLHQSRIAEGIFLSSGIAGGGARTQDRLIDTADILRKKYGFRGYIHLKIMPGAEQAQVERAMELADRVSINLEAPSSERLARLAPHKQFIEELLRPLRWVDEIRRNKAPLATWNGRWPSTVTQFVVGGSDESDLELLQTTDWLHRNVRLKRAYFSAFHPIENTPLENKPAVEPIREQRLYQASFLLRDYGFGLEELPFDQDGSLPIRVDPKMAWADANLRYQPVEINLAARHELLRVPGIGPKSVEAILRERRKSRLSDLSALKKLGIIAERAAPYLLINGHQPTSQLRLF